jgi:hypothetical protein
MYAVSFIIYTVSFIIHQGRHVAGLYFLWPVAFQDKAGGAAGMVPEQAYFQAVQRLEMTGQCGGGYIHVKVKVNVLCRFHCYVIDLLGSNNNIYLL